MYGRETDIDVREQINAEGECQLPKQNGIGIFLKPKLHVLDRATACSALRATRSNPAISINRS
jgi:hypothetical protein